MAKRNTTRLIDLSAALLTVMAGWSGVSLAQELPVPCAGSACGPTGPATWVTDGSVTGSAAGNVFNINQASQNATLNWASFNVGANGVVNFVQPDSSSVAINNIFQSDPSRIFGALNANGQIYLINQNGILFGETATVDVGGMVASSLNLTPAAIENGIVGAVRSDAAAFDQFLDANGILVDSGAVVVESGANLFADGGQVFLFAPEVINRGTIETPDGQTILAAGTTVYLAASDDSNLRGLLVEVDGEGIVTNGDAMNATGNATELIGAIAADRGNITLAGLAVNQLGELSATTSIRQNGSIRLVSRRNEEVRTTRFGTTFFPIDGGSIVVGENARMVVDLDNADTATTVDVNQQPRSLIELDAATIDVLGGAQLIAPAGDITITARSQPTVDPSLFETETGNERIYIAAGATLDVSGAEVERSVSDNIVEVELRGNQLADSPAQRDGAIRSETVLVDIRQSGIRADGTAWQGTPLADASGEISNIERTVSERNLVGGNVSLRSQGTVIVEAGATINISGGVAQYAGGDVTTTRLLAENGQIYDIADADPDRSYVDIIDSFVVEHPRWGVTEVFEGFQSLAEGTFEAGYVEGYDAGTLTVLAPQFVFDGAVTANTTAGRYQRQLPGDVVEDSLYRAFDQLPLGGSLVVGSQIGAGALPNFVTRSIELDAGLSLPSLTSADGSGFDPIADSLPDDYVSRVRTDLFGENRITRASLFANEMLSVAADADLTLPVASEINLTAGELILGGDFRSASGSYTAVAQLTATNTESTRLELQPDVVVDVAGQWVNDNPLFGAATVPLAIDGGRVELRAESGSLATGVGSLIDVSGAAHRRADGEIDFGSAGDVSLSTSPLFGGVPVETSLAGDIRAFGFVHGGSLSITAGSICIAALDCADNNSELWLSPDVGFVDGFASVELTSNLLGIELTPDTQIVGQQRNFQIASDSAFIPSGSALESFADIVVLPSIVRDPVSLALNGNSTSDELFDPTGREADLGLRLGAGSTISMDPRSDVRLSSNTVALLLGGIDAPAGRIDVTLSNELLALTNRPDGLVVLGSRGSLDVAGTSISQRDSLGRQLGTVFDGGTISITAARDGIVLLPGSSIDVSGAQAELTVRTGSANSPGFADQVVGSDAGTLLLAAGDYIVLGGDVSATGGAVTGTAGGSLFVTLDGGLRGPDPGGQFGDPTLSTNARQIILTESASPLAIPIDGPVPAQLIGTAVLGVDSLTDAGFQNISLRSETLFSRRNGLSFLASLGEIVFDGGVDWAVPGNLVLDAPSIVGRDGSVTVTANALQIGHSSQLSQLIGPSNGNDSTFSFNAAANLIELLGNTRITGFETTALSSAGDVRLTGVQLFGARDLVGQFEADSTLIIEARQLYPTTLSDFTLSTAGDDGVLDIRSMPGAPQPIYSAGGTLRLNVPTVIQGGRVAAPFGRIELVATDVQFASGSTTTTSLGDELVPFGTLQGGIDWTYELGQSETLVFDDVLNAFPQPDIDVRADSIDFQDGAIIDVSGNGDLLAYEFVPGIGGSTDFLSTAENPSLFAILPGVDLNFAPFDPAESASSSLQYGDAVFLESFAGLEAGIYTLLPARYAILPGALLVTPTEGFTDILPGEAFQSLDGGVVIAGRRTVNGTDVLATRTEGYTVLPRSRAFEESQYSLALATQFFADTPTLTPADAGSLTLATTENLNLDGELAASAAGVGARLNIASDALRIVGAPTAAVDGFVEVSAEQLEALGAESLLLGGRREQSAGGVTIDIVANEVEIADSVALAGPEIILVASERVSVGEDARLQASGNSTVDTRLALAGDGAIVRVAAGAQRRIERTNIVGATGDIDLQSGSVLASADALAIDATGVITSEAQLAIDGGDLFVGASAILLGDAPPSDTGFQLTNDDLQTLNAATLELLSRDVINVFGVTSVAASELVSITAPGLVSVADATLLISAPRVDLAGRDIPAAPVVQGTGTLQVNSETLSLLDGTLVASGFGAFNVLADAVVFAGTGSLQTAANAELASSLFATAAGADYRFDAGGALTLATRTGVDVATPTLAAGPGGRLSLTAENSVTVDSRVVVESGLLSVTTSGTAGDVILGENAAVDLSGRGYEFDSVIRSGPGGILGHPGDWKHYV